MVSLVSLWSTCACSCALLEVWLWRVICMEGDILRFNFISEIAYPTFKSIRQAVNHRLPVF